MIVWVVSYPKSGNTLVRSMLSALISSKLYGTDGSINLKRLSLIPQFPAYNYFKESVPENALTDIEKLCKYWIKIQKEINSNKKINFLKTHHLRCSVNGYNFTDINNTAGVIYIVRDPRNVFTSLKNYFDYTEDVCERLLTKIEIKQEKIFNFVGYEPDGTFLILEQMRFNLVVLEISSIFNDLRFLNAALKTNDRLYNYFSSYRTDFR